MIDKWNITIPELTGEESRRAYIYLPDSWQRNPELRYPVLYMFDGHNVFFDEDATYGKSWGLGEYWPLPRPSSSWLRWSVITTRTTAG